MALMATLQLIRNATVLLDLGGVRLLVEPALDPAGARPPVANTPNRRPNPLVELPVGAEQLVEDADAVVVTHLHADHVDDTGARLVGDRRPVLAQPGDADALRGRGVTAVTEVHDAIDHRGVAITRTGGRHGHGAVADALGPVSGFVFRAPGEPVVYLAGDTVWCDEVAAALEEHRPDVVVVNAGGARFLDSDLIVMGADDVVAVTVAAPEAQVVAVHLEAINHCLLGREELRAAVAGRRVAVPEDGEILRLGG
jgi:L-ascorbate metabolism protein UlaG (beta-lactamase superfamily)